MANAKVFRKSPKGKLAPPTDTVNAAGGVAYSKSPEGALANYACVGTIHDTYYISADKQLQDVIGMCNQVSPEFIAKTAVYARQEGYMKDLPCLLLAILLIKDVQLFKRVFPKVVDNVKMLRTFVQIIRSGVIGRKSLGSAAAKCIKRWFDGWNDANKLFNSTIGSNPSIGDIIRLAHPKPKDETFSALFAYLCGFPHSVDQLPENVKRYELLKKNYAEGVEWEELPDINFQYLTSIKLTTKNWKNIAKNASWQTTRMNLNAFAKHGVFNYPSGNGEDPAFVNLIYDRLRNAEEIAKSRVFPYQLLMAYKMTQNIPNKVRDALQDAMEISTQNVPEIAGKIIVAVDSSGSMSWNITGDRGRSSSQVKCSDVAGLIAAAIKRKNPDTTIISFDTSARKEDVNARDSVMTMANILSKSGGGTDIGSAIRYLNDNKISGDLLIIVSDNESWFDGRKSYCSGTSAMSAWNTFKVKNPNAKCICIDIQPNKTNQIKESSDVIHVAGFSDVVFELISKIAGGAGENTFVNTINDVAI